MSGVFLQGNNMRKILMLAGAAVLMAGPCFAYGSAGAGSFAGSGASLHGTGTISETSGAYNQGFSESTAGPGFFGGTASQTFSEDHGGVSSSGTGSATANEGGFANSGTEYFNYPVFPQFP